MLVGEYWLKQLFGCYCIGDATASFLSGSVHKLSEDTNSENNIDSSVVADSVFESQSQSLAPQSASTVLTQQTSSDEKAKKKRTKSKKRLDKVEIESGGSSGDGISAALSGSSSSFQLPFIATDEPASVGKRSRKIRNDGQVIRSEDVDGHCGSLPVDDLIEFIDCGRKLWRSRSQPEAALLTASEKLQSTKKESGRDAVAESDSGYGDTEIADRTDGSPSDGALSPSVYSVSESVEIVAEAVCNALDKTADQSGVKTREEELITGAFNTPSNAVSEFPVDSELSFAASFLSDEELVKPEPEFTVVRQKKRRTKNQKQLPVSNMLFTDKIGYHLAESLPCQNSSVICSSASSERSNSPHSVAATGEFTTASAHVDRRVPFCHGGNSGNDTPLFRRLNAEPKWQSRYHRVHVLPDTSSKLRPMRTPSHVSSTQTDRRWVNHATGGKCIPYVTSSRQTELDKVKDRKCSSSVGISHAGHLPDVVPSAERPQQTDKSYMLSATKVVMQDAHCQTVDDEVSQSLHSDTSVDVDQQHVPFDFLTLQLFMYHG